MNKKLRKRTGIQSRYLQRKLLKKIKHNILDKSEIQYDLTVSWKQWVEHCLVFSQYLQLPIWNQFFHSCSVSIDPVIEITQPKYTVHYIDRWEFTLAVAESEMTAYSEKGLTMEMTTNVVPVMIRIPFIYIVLFGWTRLEKFEKKSVIESPLTTKFEFLEELSIIPLFEDYLLWSTVISTCKVRIYEQEWSFAQEKWNSHSALVVQYISYATRDLIVVDVVNQGIQWTSNEHNEIQTTKVITSIRVSWCHSKILKEKIANCKRRRGGDWRWTNHLQRIFRIFNLVNFLNW